VLNLCIQRFNDEEWGVPVFDNRRLQNIRKHNKRTGCCQYGIRAYWSEKNQISLDGKPTRIVEKNG